LAGTIIGVETVVTSGTIGCRGTVDTVSSTRLAGIVVDNESGSRTLGIALTIIQVII
jgi:hypothetical protein